MNYSCPLCLATLVCASSASIAATTGYDPLANELPSALDPSFTLTNGDDPITSVTGGVAQFSMGGGDGWWAHGDAAFSAAAGWTVDIGIQAASVNTASQEFTVIVREPGQGQIQIGVRKSNFFVAGEGAGLIGGAAIAQDFTDAFHVLRVTRLGTNVRAYLDDNDTALLNATFSRTDTFGGNLLLFGKIASSSAGVYDVDFIKVDVTQSIQSAPGLIPEPASVSLLLGCALFPLLRRRNK